MNEIKREMKVSFRIKEVTSYVIVREHSSGVSGGIKQVGRYTNLDDAESVLRALVEIEPGSTWYTLPTHEGDEQ